MLQELLDYIVDHQWEWTPKKPDAVDRFINSLAICLFMSAAGYMFGQWLCIVFDIGIIGQQWRDTKLM